MPNKYNQFRKSMMKKEKSDTVKLIQLNQNIRHKLKLYPLREEILLFEKGTYRFIKRTKSITKYEFYHYIIHVPDILLFIAGKLHIIEIDGWIHSTNSHVAQKDILRNECYDTSGINYTLINEEQVLYEQGIYERRGATSAELWPTVRSKIIRLKKKHELLQNI